MTVKIITDSTADIPPAIAKELGIVVIPQYLIFGDKSFKDRIDITEDEFYDKLVNGKIQPTTSQPTPQEFANLFNEAGKNADGLLAILISSKLSGTINSAEQARKLVKVTCPIEIIDSKVIAMPLGMVVMAAARMAKAGKSLKEITASTKETCSKVKILILFDTLEYLARGGRIGKAKSLLGSLLNVKPMLTIKNGELVPVSQVRSRAKGTEKLHEFLKSFKDIEELCVVYSSDKKDAEALADSITVFPRKQIMLVRLGPVVGSHAGPGILAIALRTKS
jgi:DegV family protein with EDD domain